MNRLSSHEQNELRRAVKRKKRKMRRGRQVELAKRRADVERAKQAAEIETKLRGLSQFTGCRAADEYAAVLKAKRELL